MKIVSRCLGVAVAIFIAAALLDSQGNDGRLWALSVLAALVGGVVALREIFSG